MINLTSATEAWSKLQEDDSYLIDVRTSAEWNFVGVPLYDPHKLIKLSLFEYPDMSFNSDFLNEFNKLFKGSKNSKLFCLCRSGVRSQQAAEIFETAEFKNIYNIIDGFEGNTDNNRQRNQISGWKFSGLPWEQN